MTGRGQAIIAARFSLSCLLIDIRLCIPFAPLVIPVENRGRKSEAQQSAEKLLGLWRLINLSLIQRMTRFYENLGRVRYPVHD